MGRQARARAPGGGSVLERVTYLTGLGAFGREAFAWVAAAKGYFRDAGLEVTIVPGAAGDENLKKIAAGTAQFGGGNSMPISRSELT